MELMKDMIILLPGIMGSVLQHNNQDLWGLSMGSLFRAGTALGGNLINLKLGGDDHTVDDLGDGIKSTRLMEDTTIIPYFWKIDGYTKIARMIQSKFQVVKGDLESEAPANYYEFHYDWRRDNRVASRRLQKLIERQLPIWRKSQGDPTAKVVLIAHSMGGVIARHYLEVEGGWLDCRLLITFGTPFRGSLNTLNYMVNGYSKYLNVINQIIPTFTSCYQLLPIYKSVEVDGELKRASEIEGLENIDSERAKKAREFHLEIREAVKTNSKDLKYSEDFSIVPIVGNNQATYQSGKLIKNGGKTTLVISEDLPGSDYLESGDGTVPMTSAVPIEMKSDQVRSVIEQHGAVQNNKWVLEEVEFLLKNLRKNKPLTELFGGSNDNVGINLKLEDLYFDDESITMSAKLVNTTDFPERLAATFENIDTGQIFTGSFTPEVGQWVLMRDPLPEGSYRLKVESASADSGVNIASVNGLFLVASRKTVI
ncbi:MAG: lecithin--cholesterol acyltransferase [Acidobacteriota bacterium]|nr:lecithin--cholesterol acyltransferase [Acidobacteriota bacterium]